MVFVLLTVLSTAMSVEDLTKISWAHAVNSQSALNKTLADKSVDMIEADVIIGKLNGNGDDMPIMGHPPQNSSDLTLNAFLQNITTFNTNNKNYTKGIKLDFKSIGAFKNSTTIISSHKINCPLWLNADILAGPSADNQTATPVNVTEFLTVAKSFQNAILSLGWTTNNKSKVYTDDNVKAMLDALRANNITQNVTFAVRACAAAESKPQMVNLIKGHNSSTLTIWQSSSTDKVNIKKAKDLIATIGRNKIYLDVPADLKKQLLSNSATLSSSLGLMALLFMVFKLM